MRWGSGAQGRNRTTDTAIFSRMLYQLSYLGGLAPSRRLRWRLIGAGPGLVQSECGAISRRALSSAAELEAPSVTAPSICRSRNSNACAATL
jgi:hypothetical protein